MKSFYDLDNIIEISERRLEQYTSSYQKVLERLTTIILIYSAIAVFIIPLVQDLIFEKSQSAGFVICFILFTIFFILSLFFLVKLILPSQIAYLLSPKTYYTQYRLQYEQTITDQAQIDNLLKASFIDELEKAIENNETVFRKKSSFYFNSLIFILLASPFFLVCLGLHISKKDDKIQKVEIVSPKFNLNFNKKLDTMAKNNPPFKTVADSFRSVTKDRLPGVSDSQIIRSSPHMIKENSERYTNPKTSLGVNHKK